MKARILILLLAGSGFASAATVIQVKSFSFVPSNSVLLEFNRFSLALGTLNSVTITTNVTKSGGSLFVDNESESAASGNITQSVTINLSSVDVDLLADPSGLIGTNVTATSTYFATTGADDGDGEGVQTTGPDYAGTSFGPVSTSQTKTVRPLVQSEYQGAGSFFITAAGTQGFNTAAFGGAAIAISPATVSGDVTVTYHYTAVPEPSVALLGGLGLLALLRRRRN